MSLHELYSNYTEHCVIFHSIIRKIHVNDDISLPETLFRQIYILQAGGSDSTVFARNIQAWGKLIGQLAILLPTVCFSVSLCYRLQEKTAAL